jgi:hypothetical protein
VIQNGILDVRKKRFRSKQNTFHVVSQRAEIAHVTESGEPLRLNSEPVFDDFDHVGQRRNAHRTPPVFWREALFQSTA